MPENTFKNIKKYIGTALIISIVLYLGWMFSNIVIYILIAATLSIIGRPLVQIFDSIKIGKFKFPHVLSTILTLLIMILIIVGALSTFLPIIFRQVTAISNIDIGEVTRSFNQPLKEFQEFLISYNILNEGQTLEGIIGEQLQSIINFSSLSNIFTNILTTAGSLFISLFSILFITFFFLYEKHLFYDGIMIIIPEKYKLQTSIIISDSRRLLFRYFIGLLFEVFSMITIISTTLLLFGIKSAFLIGFLGGLMNIIPYLGPIIGASIGVVIGTISYLGTIGDIHGLWIVIITIILTFSGANLIDNMLLQPIIYSTSVKAHPLEIFLVFLIAGTIAGPIGMILAIPTYTVIRIIAKQFFSKSTFIRKITRNI